jgi:thiol-disulfide isomerase/thioredoxin
MMTVNWDKLSIVNWKPHIVLMLLVAGAASAADLRDLEDLARIQGAFPASARLRLVNVWATWCAPCVAEMPELRAIGNAFGPELALVGVSVDDAVPGSDRRKVAGFLDREKIRYPNLYYRGSPDDLGDYLKFEGAIPVTIAFDRKGKEVWRHEGPLQSASTIPELRRLLRRMP